MATSTPPPLQPHHVSTSMKVIMLVFAVILIATLGWFIMDYKADPGTTDYSASSVNKPTNSEATTAAESKTFTDEKNGFSFKYPASFYARNDTTAASEDKTLTDLMVSVNTISTTQEADGACGSISKALLQAQKTAFDSAQVGASFDTAFQTTNVGIKMSKVISAKGGTKFIRGFDLCHGVAEQTDPVQYSFMARTFKGDVAVTLIATVPLASSGGVTPKTEEAQIKLLDSGTNTSSSQTIYNNFNTLLDSFVFSK